MTYSSHEDLVGLRVYDTENKRRGTVTQGFTYRERGPVIPMVVKLDNGETTEVAHGGEAMERLRTVAWESGSRFGTSEW